MRAPLLALRSADLDGSDKLVLTLDHSRIVQNYWSQGPGTGDEIFLMASGEQPGVLNPGERIQIPIYCLGILSSDGSIDMEVRYWTEGDSTPIDWASRKESLRPATLNAATWDAVYQNLTGDLATTSDYVRMLNDNAAFLGQLGQHVVDLDDLWNFEVQQAYGETAVGVLDSAVDDSLPTPGLTLDLARRFSSNLRSRNSAGLFGDGWYTPWQATLVVENAGALVRLVGEGGSARIFTRDTRNGSYFSSTGDSSTLSSIGGGAYELRDPNGIVTRFRADGHINYVQDPNGNRITVGYDGAGRLGSLSDNYGASITIGYNPAGHVSTVSDSAGRTVTYQYDATNTYLMMVTSADGKITNYSYETAGDAAQQHALLSVTRAGATRHFTYDTHGRLESTYLASGEELVEFGYDSAGGVTETDALGTTKLYFDQNGLLARSIDPLGNPTNAEYGEDLRLSRLVEPTGESQSFTWCDCGSLTSLTDEMGQTTTYVHDEAFMRLASVTDARGETTTYQYDAQGNLLTTIYQNGSREQLGNYTAAGLPQTAMNRRNQVISYTYTSFGQIDRQTFSDGSYNDFDYDSRGNLLTVTEHHLTGTDDITTYSYNYATDGDQLRKVTYSDGRWVEYSYDTYGRRQQIADSTGQITNYEYDVAGRLWKLKDASGTVLTEYLYNASGDLDRVNNGNGTYTIYGYDAAGQLLHLINHAPDASVSSQFDYTYDSRGRRIGMSTLEGSWTYTYDPTSQLIRAQFLSTTPGISNQDLKYTYDAVGNRTLSVINGVTTNYVANEVNEYTTVGGIAFQYDADGNLLFDGVSHYTYDAQNRLVHATGPEGVTDYEYDAFGHRTATIFNGQRTEYLLDPTGLVNVVAEFDGAGSVKAAYTYGLELTSRTDAAGARSFYDFDALGSTVGLTNSLGQVVNSYSYLPFGETQNTVESVANDFEFIGSLGVMNEVSGRSFMRARFYMPSVGSFTSIDPIRPAGANFYAYVDNRALDFIDPLGLSGLDANKPPTPPPSSSDDDGCSKKSARQIAALSKSPGRTSLCQVVVIATLRKSARRTSACQVVIAAMAVL